MLLKNRNVPFLKQQKYSRRGTNISAVYSYAINQDV